MDGVYGPLIVTDAYANSEIAVKYDKEFYFMVQELYMQRGSDIVEHIIWEDGKYLYGFDEMKICAASLYTDDGTPGIMLPFVRETDAIVINGKVSKEKISNSILYK